MTQASGYRGRLAPLLLSVLGLMVAQVASAKSAVGSVMAIISALLIYFKMQYHEGEVVKNIMTLIGAVLFIIGASIVFPAFFGYRI